MERKYPVSFFVMGILLNLVKYIFIGLVGTIFLIIGFSGVNICKTIGIVILTGYLVLCVIEQLINRSTILKESNNSELNEFLDHAFGVNKQDETNLSPSQRIINIVEDKIKSQDKDENN